MQLQVNESDLKIFLQTTIYLSAALSDGIENPEVFVSNVNDILELNGHMPILVPSNVIASSKKIFLNKTQNSIHVSQ